MNKHIGSSLDDFMAECGMNDAPRLGANPVSNMGDVSSILTGAATSHTVALIRMGEDGKITYGGDKERIRELVSRLVAAHD